MIAQRPAEAAPCVRGVAEALPLADGSVDAALAVLTIHHWSDLAAGVAELRRVARRRIVVLTWEQADPAFLTDGLTRLADDIDSAAGGSGTPTSWNSTPATASSSPTSTEHDACRATGNTGSSTRTSNSAPRLMRDAAGHHVPRPWVQPE